MTRKKTNKRVLERELERALASNWGDMQELVSGRESNYLVAHVNGTKPEFSMSVRFPLDWKGALFDYNKHLKIALEFALENGFTLQDVSRYMSYHYDYRPKENKRPILKLA